MTTALRAEAYGWIEVNSTKFLSEVLRSQLPQVSVVPPASSVASLMLINLGTASVEMTAITTVSTAIRRSLSGRSYLTRRQCNPARCRVTSFFIFCRECWNLSVVAAPTAIRKENRMPIEQKRNVCAAIGGSRIACRKISVRKLLWPMPPTESLEETMPWASSLVARGGLASGRRLATDLAASDEILNVHS